MMKNGLRRMQIALRNQIEELPVEIVRDAVIATAAVGNGQLIPLLILDTTNRPDVERMIDLHLHVPPGDVKSTWGKKRRNRDEVFLLLQFSRPSELTLVIPFDLVKYGGLVDRILQAKAVYLQPGKPGDRFDPTLEAPGILIEVGVDFGGNWDTIINKALTRDLRKKGVRHKEALQAAKLMREKWQEIWKLRI
jgi:hypothetical protein